MIVNAMLIMQALIGKSYFPVRVYYSFMGIAVWLDMILDSCQDK